MLSDKCDVNHKLADAVLKDIMDDLRFELESGGVEQRTFFLPKLMEPLNEQLQSQVPTSVDLAHRCSALIRLGCVLRLLSGVPQHCSGLLTS